MLDSAIVSLLALILPLPRTCSVGEKLFAAAMSCRNFWGMFVSPTRTFSSFSPRFACGNEVWRSISIWVIYRGWCHASWNELLFENLHWLSYAVSLSLDWGAAATVSVAGLSRQDHWQSNAAFVKFGKTCLLVQLLETMLFSCDFVAAYYCSAP